MKSFLALETFDMTLVCEDGKQVEAHKVILAGQEHRRFMILN